MQLQALLGFLGITVDQTVLTGLLNLVDKPASVGRYLPHGTSRFNETDLAFVRKLGYL